MAVGRGGERQTAEGPAAVAAEALFARCERPVGRFLVQMVGDRSLAEDLLQDTFMTLSVPARSF
jgi:DNA-directed RNA polymerase specialized sigma24 family protein